MFTPRKIRAVGIQAAALPAAAVLSIALLLAATAPASAEAKITTFDPPGSAGTFPRGINAGGSIAGSYVQGGQTHGFLRSPDGSFTTFDAAGGNIATYSVGISRKGVIAGSFSDGSYEMQGFRAAPARKDHRVRTR